jgi:hypothetical protein
MAGVGISTVFSAKFGKVGEDARKYGCRILGMLDMHLTL